MQVPDEGGLEATAPGETDTVPHDATRVLGEFTDSTTQRANHFRSEASVGLLDGRLHVPRFARNIKTATHCAVC